MSRSRSSDSTSSGFRSCVFEAVRELLAWWVTSKSCSCSAACGGARARNRNRTWRTRITKPERVRRTSLSAAHTRLDRTTHDSMTSTAALSTSTSTKGERIIPVYFDVTVHGKTARTTSQLSSYRMGAMTLRPRPSLLGGESGWTARTAASDSHLASQRIWQPGSASDRARGARTRR